MTRRAFMGVFMLFPMDFSKACVHTRCAPSAASEELRDEIGVDAFRGRRDQQRKKAA